MRPLFVDTAGWLAAADRADIRHEEVCGARDAWMEEGGLLLTTDYVIDETLTMLRLRLGLHAAKAWWDMLEKSPRVRIERIDAERATRARAIFFRYRDKTFSFTDCSSFAVMKELSIKKALTLDAHFQKAGFECIPHPVTR